MKPTDESERSDRSRRRALLMQRLQAGDADACRELLENYKIPRSFSFVPQMPRTLTGKTDKRTLAASAVK